MDTTDFRCCLCPNINTPRKKICPPGGPAHKPETPCRFVVTFLNSNNRLVFVDHGINTNKKKWISVKELPAREIFDEAQHDLNVYAMNKDWKLAHERN